MTTESKNALPAELETVGWTDIDAYGRFWRKKLREANTKYINAQSERSAETWNLHMDRAQRNIFHALEIVERWKDKYGDPRAVQKQREQSPPITV